MLYVVRHASAGNRDEWPGEDRARPLDQYGREQADRLVELFEGRPLSRLVTSPYRRCVETVEPLARARQLPPEYRHELGDDAAPADALSFLGELGSDAVVCSHGDLIRELLGEELEKGEAAAVDVTDRGAVIRERRRATGS